MAKKKPKASKTAALAPPPNTPTQANAGVAAGTTFLRFAPASSHSGSVNSRMSVKTPARTVKRALIGGS